MTASRMSYASCGSELVTVSMKRFVSATASALMLPFI